MYFAECERLAEARPEWRPAIERIDNLLYQNTGGPIDPTLLYDFAGQPQRIVDAILTHLEHDGLIRRATAPYCPRHRAVLPSPSGGSSPSCDLCDASDEPQLSTIEAILVTIPAKQKKVFISHASIDKPMIERLVADLEKMNLDVWFDAHAINVSDSIPQAINEGLRDADYVLVALSEHSIRSLWVQMETDAAMVAQAAGEKTVVVPIKLDDCEVPPLLRPRLYANLSDYGQALEKLAKLFESESAPITSTKPPTKEPSCTQQLESLTKGDLRSRICNLGRDELALLWYDVLESDMADDYRHETLGTCAMKLLIACERQSALSQLYNAICRTPERRRVILSAGTDPA